MCGFDSSGPIVCCPRNSNNLQFPKTNQQRPKELEQRRPDLNFAHEMQGDQPINTYRPSDYYHYSSEENRPKYNSERVSVWNSGEDNPYLSAPSTSTWSSNGRRKSTHDKPFDYGRPETSTNRYPSFNEEQYRPQRKPSYELNSYETNDFRPDNSNPNEFSSNNEGPTWNGNNRPSASNEWSNSRPSYSNSPNGNPHYSNINRPSNFGSGNNGGEDEDRPVWEFVKEKSTSRPQPSYQNGFSRPKRISQISKYNVFLLYYIRLKNKNLYHYQITLAY